MSEITLTIKDDGLITVCQSCGICKSVKHITPDSLLSCVIRSIDRGKVSSGLLPKGCLSYTTFDNGDREVYILHPENKADISYYGTEYKDFPLSKLVFGFHITKEGRVGSCKLGVIANDDVLKPDTKMFHYPFSNVNGFHLCTGNNVLPKCVNLHTLGSLQYYILSMPNNNDYFSSKNNRPGLEMRELLELLKDKQAEFYYSDILIPNGAVLNDFLSGQS